MTGLLDGVRIVEFSYYGSGPLAGQILGDTGADVIKVEPTTGDPWRRNLPILPNEGFAFLPVNRSKRGIGLDLKHPGSVEILERLIRTADVVLTNYRRAALEKLGIDYPALSKLNPRLVYVSIAMADDPPGAPSTPGYDQTAQAASGLMAADEKLTADGLPLAVGSAPADFASGFVGAFAVSSGLAHVHRTGEGT